MIRALLCAWLLLCTGCLQAAQALLRPGEVWVVEHVDVDRRNQPAWRYVPDDPRLMFDLVRVRADGAMRLSRADSPWCRSARWTREPEVALSALVGRTMRRAPTAGRPEVPVLAEFSPRLTDLRLSPHRVACAESDENLPTDPFWSNSWIARPAADRLIVGLQGEAIVELRRLGANALLAPSFNCQYAAQASERAICDSPELAGYDRSVALAYEHELSLLEPNEVQPFKQAQLKWLHTRDACGANTDCLGAALAQRLSSLRQR